MEAIGWQLIFSVGWKFFFLSLSGGCDLGVFYMAGVGQLSDGTGCRMRAE